MELKRIVAQDARSAIALATSRYGKDALIVSNERVNGNVEIVVAVDIGEPLDETWLGEESTSPASAPAALPVGGPGSGSGRHSSGGEMRFGDLLQGAIGAPEVEVEYAPTALPSPRHRKAHKPVKEVRVDGPVEAEASTGQASAERERARDLVSLIRDELGELRREFRLSRQVDLWQSGQGVSEAVRGLVEVMPEAGVPAALRGLLIDQIRESESEQAAFDVLTRTLRAALGERQSAMPLAGIHVLAGPAGSGKSLMAARLATAHAASGAFGPDGVALVSYCDDRAGAWGQLQLLAARAGVECFRAANAGMLERVLDDLEGRRLVLIDTGAPRAVESVREIRQLRDNARVHLVLPLDASLAQVHRQVRLSGVDWDDVMISRMDEPGNPWPLIQMLCEGRLQSSFGGFGTALDDLIDAQDIDLLIERAIETLQWARELSQTVITND